jgi:hypothetical protein
MNASRQGGCEEVELIHAAQKIAVIGMSHVLAEISVMD